MKMAMVCLAFFFKAGCFAAMAVVSAPAWAAGAAQSDDGQGTSEFSLDPALTYGSATRVLTQGPLNELKDIIGGGAGTAIHAGLTASTLTGTQAARGQTTPKGPVAGAWSFSSNGSGSARGIAYRTYINNSAGPLTFNVNAVFDGKFLPAPYRIPSGPLKAGGAIHVFDAQAFATRLASATGGSAQFLLGSYTPAAAANPTNAFANLRGLFPGGLLGTGETVLNTTTTPVSAAVSTGSVTVAPQQKFTVVYDVSTSSVAQTVGERSASGVANFLNTLAPAAVHFTDAAGSAVTGIALADTAPASTTTPNSVNLTAVPATRPAGGTAILRAEVYGSTTYGGNSVSFGPIANRPVEFYITAGPNIGKTGVAITDTNGLANFSYVGDNDVGKDVVEARIAGLQSNTAEHTWTAARCPQNQAFWVRYPGLWPMTLLSIGGQDYDQAALVKLLKLAPTNPSLALLQQVAVTKLNAAYGGDTSLLTLYLLAADKLLVNFNRAQPSQNQVSLQISAQMVALAARMAIYNAGLTSKTCTP